MPQYTESKQEKDLVNKTETNVGELSQIFLRVSALATSVAATWLTFTSHQIALVYGIELEAKYSYSPTIKFFAVANLIASVFGLLSLSLTVTLWRHGSLGNHTLFFFLHDLGMMSLELAGCSAATAIGYVAKFGNKYSGWMPICEHFQSFCHRSTAAVVLGYLSLILFLVLTILSATKSNRRNIATQVHQNF